MTFRDLAPGDEAAAAALTPGWSEADYAGIARGELRDRICLVTTELTGLILISAVPPDAEILNIFVASDARRQGIGTGLLQAAIERLTAMGVKRCWLEVRESNAAALSIYEAQGFRQTGRRKEYYHQPQEDALVLEKRLEKNLWVVS